MRITRSVWTGLKYYLLVETAGISTCCSTHLVCQIDKAHHQHSWCLNHISKMTKQNCTSTWAGIATNDPGSNQAINIFITFELLTKKITGSSFGTVGFRNQWVWVRIQPSAILITCFYLLFTVEKTKRKIFSLFFRWCIP